MNPQLGTPLSGNPLPEDYLGLEILYASEEADVDIIAVHGLGAYPPKAWIRAVIASDGSTRDVNWLKDSDMLPSHIPNTRIMAFNYGSRWLWDAPKQTTVNCATQLLTAIEGLRQRASIPKRLRHEVLEPHTRSRPIIFIGHSFGGVVIEQSIVECLSHASNDTSSFNLAEVTTGMIFLGVPFRGSMASKWATVLAKTASCLSFHAEQRVIDQLDVYSESLKDLLAKFARWLWSRHVSTHCFYEQHGTDYGKRFGLAWKELVVDEHSACIDAAQREGLPADHLTINKFTGPTSPCYTAVLTKLKSLAEHANPALSARQNPREYVNDDRNVFSEDGECIRSLFDGLNQPVDDMRRIHYRKGKETQGTCEWILGEPSYVTWRYSQEGALLRIVGPPGIGKTMLSMHLVEHLISDLKVAPSKVLLAAFFYEHSKRFRAADIVRSWIVQLVQQRPDLGRHIRPDFRVHGNHLRANFDVLWRILTTFLASKDTVPIVLCLDALDECDLEAQKEILSSLVDFFGRDRNPMVKMIITSRPEHHIETALRHVGLRIKVDSTTISDDLTEYISHKISELKLNHQLPEASCHLIRKHLQLNNDGTFLWISFAIQELQSAKNARTMFALLNDFPTKLYEVYDRILCEIRREDQQEAMQILRTIMVAGDTLNDADLAMLLRVKDPSCRRLPSPLEVCETMGSYKSCGPLLVLEQRTRQSQSTIKFVHASVKDYLTSSYLENHERLSQFYCQTSRCQLGLFENCCKFRWLAREYLPLPHPSDIMRSWLVPRALLHLAGTGLVDDYGTSVEKPDETDVQARYDKLAPEFGSLEWYPSFCVPLSGYCIPGILENDDWFFLNLIEHSRHMSNFEVDPQTLRILDTWQDPDFLMYAVRHRSRFWTNFFCQCEYIDVNRAANYTTALHTAVGQRETSVLESILSHPKVDVNMRDYLFGTTPLIHAAGSNYTDGIKLLLNRSETDVHAQEDEGYSAIQTACRVLSLESLEILLAKGAHLSDNLLHRVCCSTAAQTLENAHSDTKLILSRRLAAGLLIDGLDNSGRTPLQCLLSGSGGFHHTPLAVETLFGLGADIHALSVDGETAIFFALHSLEYVDALLTYGADANTVNNKGITPVIHFWASTPRDYMVFHYGCINPLPVIEALMNHSADPFARDYDNCTAREHCFRWFRDEFVFSGPGKRDYLHLLNQASEVFGEVSKILPPEEDAEAVLIEILQYLEGGVGNSSERSAFRCNYDDAAKQVRNQLKTLLGIGSWQERFHDWQVMARDRGWKTEPDVVWHCGHGWLMHWWSAGALTLPTFCLMTYVRQILREPGGNTVHWKKTTIPHFCNSKADKGAVRAGILEIDFQREADLD